TMGARMTSEFNYDYSCVGIQAPRGVFVEAARVLAECLKEPDLAAATLDQRRAEAIQCLKREKESPDALLRKMANQVFYAGNACENRPEGTPENLEKFDADGCRDALAQAMVANRVVLVFVTPYETDEVRKLAQASFGFIKEGGATKPYPGPAHPTERQAFEKRQTPTTYIRGQFAMPGPSEPGFAAARVLMTVLSQHLWEEIRTKRALSYAPNAGLAQTRVNFGIVYATAKDATKTLEVMNAEIAKLKEELIPASDIKNIVNGDITGKAMRSEGAMGHANALGRAELLSGGWRRFYDESEDLAKVTPEQVREAARKFLVRPHWAFVGPEAIEEKLLGD